MLKKLIVPAALLALPIFASAQGPNLTYFEQLIDKIGTIVEQLIPIVIGIGLLVFLWGLMTYIFTKDEDKKKESKTFMIYGIIILFVMVSVWGLVQMLQRILNINGGVVPSAPGVPR